MMGRISNKIAMGLYANGVCVSPVGNTVEATETNLSIMNTLTGLLDDMYQQLKKQYGIADGSYIAFDYK